jgi:hypothetical protein
MKFVQVALSALSILGPFAGAPTVALAQDRSILIVGEDADEDSVPRFTRIFVQVVGALTEELGAAGFEVLDETAVSLGNFTQDRVRHDVAEISASVVGTSVNLALSLNLYASADEQRYRTRINTRATRRLIDAGTGQRLGAFEISGPRPLNAPLDCSRACVLETVGRHTGQLVRHVSDLLTVELVELTESGRERSKVRGAPWRHLEAGRYKLVFRGFDSDEMSDFERFFAVFGGYKGHQEVLTEGRHFEYRYESDASSVEL